MYPKYTQITFSHIVVHNFTRLQNDKNECTIKFYSLFGKYGQTLKLITEKYFLIIDYLYNLNNETKYFKHF